MAKNRITLYDVAEHVGFSKSTVAYVMSGKAGDVGVAQKTIEKIETAATELGYVPNYWASSLARQSTGMISVLLDGLWGGWANEVMFAISQTLRMQTYTPFLAADWEDPQLFEKEVSATIQRRDEGVICHSFIGEAKQYARIVDSGIPLVFLGAVPLRLEGLPGVNSVVWNDAPAVETAVRHLVDTGRRKIAFLGAEHGVRSDRRRFMAYEKVIQEAGLELREEWQDWIGMDQFPDSPTRGSMERFFAPGKEWPDALFALNDVIALDALLMAEEMGIRVPDDLAVIGMGDLPITKNVSLSTMHEPLRELGAAAAQMVLELIDNPEKTPLHREIDCNELVIRKSTGG